MDHNKLEHYRKKLDELRRGLAAACIRNRDYGKEPGDGAPQDFADKAASACTRELVFSLSDRERSILAEIHQAAERMQNDGYGTCMECEEPISSKRLNAVPWARLCFSCQQRAEQENLHQVGLDAPDVGRAPSWPRWSADGALPAGDGAARAVNPWMDGA